MLTDTRGITFNTLTQFLPIPVLPALPTGTFTVNSPPATGGSAAAAPPPPPPDPRVLAERAIASMQLRAIDIGIVPEPGADRMGLIGLPTWMWVENPDPHTWGPITRSVSLRGVTATVTAQVDRIVWNMGGGTTVTCTTPGTPYADHYGDSDSPDCGHRYTQTSVGQPGNAYTVTATSYWNIEWSGAGQSGTVSMDLSASAPIRVGEMQVLVTN